MAGSFGFNRINWNAMALCILAATVFWLFSALNKDHVSTLAVPLQVVVNDSLYIAIARNPESIKVQVEGKGWDLLVKQFGWRLDPLTVRIENPVAQTFLLTQSMVRQIREATGNLRILHFTTDTLHFRYDEKTTRQVQISADLSAIRYKKGYDVLDSVTIQPNTISITGPSYLINKITDPLIIRPSENRVSGKFQKNIRPDLPERSVSSPGELKVSFDAILVKEISLMIPVRYPPKKIRSREKAFIDSIQIRLLIPEEMDPATLKSVSADLLNVKTANARIIFNGLPSRVRLIHADTLSIDI